MKVSRLWQGTAPVQVAPGQAGVVPAAVWGGLVDALAAGFKVIVEHFLGLLGLGASR